MKIKKYLLLIVIFCSILNINLYASDEWSFMINDHVGNTRAVLDEYGNTRAIYDYYPYGLEMHSMVSGKETRFKYTGKELDEAGGLNWYYYGARFYDPQIGRFMGVDPLAVKYPTLSPYVYSANNPVMLFDVDGRYIMRGNMVLRYPIGMAYTIEYGSMVSTLGAFAIYGTQHLLGDHNYDFFTLASLTPADNVFMIGSKLMTYASKTGIISEKALMVAGLSMGKLPLDMVQGLTDNNTVNKTYRDMAIQYVLVNLGVAVDRTHRLCAVDRTFPTIEVVNMKLIESLLGYKANPADFVEVVESFFKMKKNEFIEDHGEKLYDKLKEAYDKENTFMPLDRDRSFTFDIHFEIK